MHAGVGRCRRIGVIRVVCYFSLVSVGRVLKHQNVTWKKNQSHKFFLFVYERRTETPFWQIKRQVFERVEFLHLKTHRRTEKKTYGPNFLSSVILMFLCATERNTILRNKIFFFELDESLNLKTHRRTEKKCGPHFNQVTQKQEGKNDMPPQFWFLGYLHL